MRGGGRTAEVDAGGGRSPWRGGFWVLAAVLLAGVCLVPPVHDFPLNDEWLFQRMVETLLSEHRYVHHPYVQPTSVALVGWGALFGHVFGAGLPALRLSVVPFALLGAWAAVQCARACGLARGPALLCGLVLLVDPLFFSLSTSFMTDVPSCALSILSAWFYLRALRRGDARSAFWGSMAAVLGFFVRQFAVLPALAYAAVVGASALGRRGRAGSPSWRTVVGFGLPWILAALGFWWWRVWGGGGEAWSFPTAAPWTLRAFVAVVYFFIVVSTLGLLLAPLALARAVALVKGCERWSRWWWVVFAGHGLLATAVFVFRQRAPLPLIGNILDFYSMGPRALVGQPIVTVEGFRAVYLAWCAATVVGVLSGSLLVVSALRALAGRAGTDAASGVPFDRRHAWFLGLWAAAVFATSYTPLTAKPLDRYLIPLVVVGAILLAGGLGRHPGRGATGLAVAALLGLYAYSIALQHEYLGWNRARWQAIDQLMNERGVPAAEIDAGYEFNGVYKSDEYQRVKGPRPFRMCLENNVWFPLRDRYRLALGPLADHSALARVPYFSWFTLGDRYVYVLEIHPVP